MKIIKKAITFLQASEFVVVATADKEGKPNCAPKLLLKIDGEVIYFIDYSIGRTFRNLRVNPQISLSFMDIHSLSGYRLSGSVEIIENGEVYDECLKELRVKEIDLSVERIVKGVQNGKVHKYFESEIPERFLIYKVKIEDGCEITPRGLIRRERRA
jgi:predicted pyridoxine 5'-phosphate oxidase superfamily flavin-nucleotide-binding protein